MEFSGSRNILKYLFILNHTPEQDDSSSIPVLSLLRRNLPWTRALNQEAVIRSDLEVVVTKKGQKEDRTNETITQDER